LQSHSDKTHGISSVETVRHFHFTVLFFNAMPDFQSLPEWFTVLKFKPLSVLLDRLGNVKATPRNA
jgi:hypothetical protein